MHQWTPSCEVAFQTLKEELIKLPELRQPDFSKPFILTTDASDYAIGGVLSQSHDGVEYPVAFESRKLNQAEANYPVHEKELLAIVHCLKVWRCYVEGVKCKVRTDHASLKYFQTQKVPSRRIGCWFEYLQQYDLDICYTPGKNNVVADALSRNPMLLNQMEESDWPQLVMEYIQSQSISTACSEDIRALVKKEAKNFVVEDETLYRVIDGTPVPFCPFVSRLDLVHKLHNGYGYLGIEGTYDLVKSKAWWPNLTKDVVKLVKTCPNCQLNQEQSTRHAELFPLEPVAPFERWGIDFIGRLPTTKKGNRWILVAIDHATKWPIAKAVPVATEEVVANFIYQEILMQFGCPVEILSDRGANFMAKTLETYLELQKIKHLRTSAYHPRTNGVTERFNGLLGKMVTKYANGQLSK